MEEPTKGDEDETNSDSHQVPREPSSNGSNSSGSNISNSNSSSSMKGGNRGGIVLIKGWKVTGRQVHGEDGAAIASEERYVITASRRFIWYRGNPPCSMRKEGAVCLIRFIVCICNQCV